MKYIKKISKQYNYSNQNKCKDCGKIIDNRATYCKQHAYLGKRNCHYKHGQSNNPEYYRQNALIYYREHRKKVLKYNREYYVKNRQKIINYNITYRKEKRRNDIHIRLKDRLSKRIWDAVKQNRKSKKSMQLLGCTIPELKKHLQKQFKPGMTWNNYGKWHIDHIKPCCSFDLSKPEEQAICFNYNNLQPLWAKENFHKNGKY